MPLNVVMTGVHLKRLSGVGNFVKLLMQHMDKDHVAFTYVGVGKFDTSSPFWRRPFEYAASIAGFIRAIQRTRPDLVHLNPSLNWTSLPLHACLLISAKALGRPVYQFLHGWDDLIAQAMIRGTWKGRFVKSVLARADYTTVLCNTFRDRLIQAGWSPGRVGISSLIIETEKYEVLDREERLACEPERGFQVLFMSLLARDKGVWELMAAVEWLRGTHPDAPLRFVYAGDGPELQPLRAYAEDKGLSDAVQFVGYVRGEDKHAAYRKADLFVLPSYHNEGFPTVVIEALAAGLPIIYTPMGALGEVLGPENGSCIELSELSGKSVGQLIWDLYQQPYRRRAMAVFNQRLARRYDAREVCAQMAEIYRHVAEL